MKESVASKGWFVHFKACANLHNLKVPGEAATGDAKAAGDFPSALAEIIREGVTVINKCLTWTRQACSGSLCLHVRTLPRRRRQHQAIKPARRD